jgi:hypothetical protein
MTCVTVFDTHIFTINICYAVLLGYGCCVQLIISGLQLRKFFKTGPVLKDCLKNFEIYYNDGILTQQYGGHGGK